MFEKMLPMIFSALGVTPEHAQKFMSDIRDCIEYVKTEVKLMRDEQADQSARLAQIEKHLMPETPIISMENKTND